MINEKVKFNYDDVAIIPDIVTDIKSRKECNPLMEDGMSPIWAAPMDTVVNLDNWKTFYDAKVNVIIPRNVDLYERVKIMTDCSFIDSKYKPFVALSLAEAKSVFLEKDRFKNVRMRLEYNKDYLEEDSGLRYIMRICIDMANGHMQEQINTIKEIKDLYGENVVIVGGNVGNPKTYELYDKAGCDYLRVSIGGGAGCLTASNCAIHFPIFSLLEETYRLKQKIGGKCKIIADGGIKGFRDVQKALIFADCAMMGSVFNKAIESAGKTTYGSFYWNIRGKKIYRPIKTLLYYGREVPKEKYGEVVELIKGNKLSVWKEFYGMSTKKAQKSILDGNGIRSKGNLKTSEGIILHQKVEYSIMGWMRNEMDYLRSAMSYTNSRTLDEYKDSEYVVLNEINYNK